MHHVPASARLAALFFLLVPAAGEGLLAQGGVNYAPSYGLAQVNSSHVYPYVSFPMRYQQIHDAWTFSDTRPTLIRSVSYRPGRLSRFLNRSGGTVDVMLQMALTPKGVDSTKASKSFAKNIDASTLKTVFRRKRISYPNSGKNPTELEIFDISFPFDTGVAFLYQPLKQRSLLVETRQYGRTGGSFGFDYVWRTSDTGHGFAAPNGSYAGCKNRAGRVVDYLADGVSLKLGGDSAFEAVAYSSGIPTMLSFGARPLAITLPGTSCKIVNDLLFLASGLTNSAGRFIHKLKIPNVASLYRSTFLTQAIFFERGANAVGVVTSRGIWAGIGFGPARTNMGIARIYAQSKTPDSLTTASSTSPSGLLTMFKN